MNTTKYQEFLNKIKIVSEDKFNKVVELFPDVEIDSLEIEDLEDVIEVNERDTEVLDNLSRIFANSVLNKYNYAWVDDINFSNKEMTLEDIDTLEDLKEIKKKLSNWTIENYKEIKRSLEEEKREEEENRINSKKKNLLFSVIDYITLEEATEIHDKYVNKG